MRAMVLSAPGRLLELRDRPEPTPTAGQVLIEVEACGICRTDLHVVDGDLAPLGHPVVPGHQIVGTVAGSGERVGVPWLGWTCGACRYCRAGRENLCDSARFTGYHIDGGFAERCVADRRYTFPIPVGMTALSAAPLLCAGMIGTRALAMAGDAPRIGFYGFGAAAHIAIQVARHRGAEIHAFTRPGDERGQAFARRLGAAWVGGSDQLPPQPLDAAILFAPVGELVPTALAAVGKGGRVICAGIHMSDIPSFPYSLLWGERSIRSVANLTRRDGEEFFAAAAAAGVQTTVAAYPLADANRALDDLRAGRVEGAAVLAIS
jgi:propanol-preferring alcohol dehydrogenase